MSGFDYSQLSSFARETLKFAEDEYPKETKKFLKEQANRVTEILSDNVNSTTKKKTGRLSRAAEPGKPYKFKGDETTLSIRGYLRNNKKAPDSSAPHAHLLNTGHNLVPRGKKGKSNKGGKAIGFIKGREFIKKTQDSFENEFMSKCEEFAAEISSKFDK